MRASSGRSGGGFGTLIGNGWLRESPRGGPVDVQRWQSRSKSWLRKCMFMQVPEEVRKLVPQMSHAALLPAPAPRPEQPIVAHRRDPRKDAREFPASVMPAPPVAQRAAAAPLGVDPRMAAQQAYAIHMQNAQRAAVLAASQPAQAWWEDPVALGSLLILVPPVGLAAVWSSKKYSSDARWALTVMTGLTMCLMTAIVIAVLAMH